MKYGKEMTEKCVKYVEKNGLMQRFGSTLKAFCKEMGISQDTYFDWMQKSEFSESIKKAQQAFDSNITIEAEKSLAKLVRGYKSVKLEEFGDIDPNTGKMKPKTAKRTTMEVKPDVGACIFVLTNQDPEKWQNRKSENLTVKTEEKKQMTIEEIDAELARLDRMEQTLKKNSKEQPRNE